MPGLPIWPAGARCRLISAAFLAVPLLRLVEAHGTTGSAWRRPARNQRAAVPGQVSTLTPQMRDPPGVESAPSGLERRSPGVGGDEGRVDPASSQHDVQHAAEEQHVGAGLICRCRSAIAAVSVRRGSTTTIFMPRAAASSMRRNRMGWPRPCCCPLMNRQSVVRHVVVAGQAARPSPASLGSPPPRGAAHAQRELVSILLVPTRPRASLLKTYGSPRSATGRRGEGRRHRARARCDDGRRKPVGGASAIASSSQGRRAPRRSRRIGCSSRAWRVIALAGRQAGPDALVQSRPKLAGCRDRRRRR